tara:strand:- start:21 stop:200 length:180 start_codon:yes stop_codon:yes gene_type:complete
MAKKKGNSKTTSEEQKTLLEIEADRISKMLADSGSTAMEMPTQSDTTQYSVNFVPRKQP